MLVCPEKRKCNACGEMKVINEFYNDRSRSCGKSYTCKVCKNKNTKIYNSNLGKQDYENGVLNNAQRRARYYKKYKDTKIKDYSLKRNYKISLEQYEKMLSETNGICEICGKEMKRPVVDHNHKTGKIRGIICSKCNSTIGLCDESIETLKKCIIYLEKNYD